MRKYLCPSLLRTSSILTYLLLCNAHLNSPNISIKSHTLAVLSSLTVLLSLKYTLSTVTNLKTCTDIMRIVNGRGSSSDTHYSIILHTHK